MINREIASEEERHQTLLAEAATVRQSIEKMQKAVQGLQTLIGDDAAERRPARRGRGPGRKGSKARSGRKRGRKAFAGKVAPAAVLAAISGSGQHGVMRSALSGLLANRRGEEPTRKALDEALQSLLSEMSIRREGYRFVAVGSAAPGAAAEAVQAESALPSDGGGEEQLAVQSAGKAIPFEEDPATGETGETELPAPVARSGGGRRGRPRKPVSAEVARAMAEVAGVIAQAGKEGCKMAAIRAGVAQATGVSLSSAEATRAVKDLLNEGRVHRDGYRYVAS